MTKKQLENLLNSKFPKGTELKEITYYYIVEEAKKALKKEMEFDDAFFTYSYTGNRIDVIYYGMVLIHINVYRHFETSGRHRTYVVNTIGVSPSLQFYNNEDFKSVKEEIEAQIKRRQEEYQKTEEYKKVLCKQIKQLMPEEYKGLNEYQFWKLVELVAHSYDYYGKGVE